VPRSIIAPLMIFGREKPTDDDGSPYARQPIDQVCIELQLTSFAREPNKKLCRDAFLSPSIPNIWVDLTDPTTPELLNVQQSFHLDGKALEEYTNILSSIVDKYEQLLTAIELSVPDIEQRSFYRPSRKILEYLDNLSRQIIILRRHL